MTGSAPKAPVWMGWATAAIVVVVMAGAFELACRTVLDTGTQYHIEMWKYAVEAKQVAADPAIGHENKPNARAHLMNTDVAINSTGDRNGEVSTPKPPGTFRIAMLGDSLTFGWGVEQADTFTEIVERDLYAKGYANVETVNLGVGNYNTSMEVTAFLKRVDRLQPDFVVLNYFINDAEPTPRYSPLPWYARTFYAYPIVGGAWDALKRAVLGSPDWKDYYAALYKPGAAGWQQTQAAIKRLADQCRARGIPLVMVNLPELRELAPYPFTEVNRMVEAAAQDAGVAYIDMLPVLANEQPSTLWVTVPDPHPNAKAHALIGHALADDLEPYVAKADDHITPSVDK
ncbi:MAG: SGNH/GDSL hydrolase family protein [Rhodobacteraceae bacterium]|nr:SGNH/GDSL hydrolase family protein [Paracoccaceae bacterium]